MAFEKGKSGNPLGRKSEKPFADALRMELAAAGTNHKALRAIARNLIGLAQKDDREALPAINTIADRLDGKPAQESNVIITRRAEELTDQEIAARIAELRGAGASGDDGEAPINPSQLN